MINSKLFLSLSGLRYKRLRLRYVGFITLIIAMGLIAFGCSFPGSSSPSPKDNPCSQGYHEYTDPNTGQKQCVQVIKGSPDNQEKIAGDKR